MSMTRGNASRAAGSAAVVILYDVLVGKKKGKESIIPEGEAPSGKRGRMGGKWENSFKDGGVMVLASLLNDWWFNQMLTNVGLSPMPAGIVGDGLLYAGGQYLIRKKKKFMMNFLLGAGASYAGQLIAPYSTDYVINAVVSQPMSGSSQSNRRVTPDYAPATLGQPLGNLQSATGY
jgi:hypothetical protein